MNITMFAGGLNPLATLCLKLGFGFSATALFHIPVEALTFDCLAVCHSGFSPCINIRNGGSTFARRASTAVTSGMLNTLATYKATIGTTLNFIATTASNVFPIGALIDRSYLAAAFVVVS